MKCARCGQELQAGDLAVPVFRLMEGFTAAWANPTTNIFAHLDCPETDTPTNGGTTNE